MNTVPWLGTMSCRVSRVAGLWTCARLLDDSLSDGSDMRTHF